MLFCLNVKLVMFSSARVLFNSPCVTLQPHDYVNSLDGNKLITKIKVSTT